MGASRDVVVRRMNQIAVKLAPRTRWFVE